MANDARLNINKLRLSDPVWHALVTAITKDTERFDAYRKAAEADPQDEIDVTLVVRGIEFPFKPVFERYREAFDAEVREAAERLWQERMGETMAAMDAKIREAFGLPANPEES